IKGPGSNDRLYNGKESDSETSWLDYGARQYDNSLGRWMVVDPLAESQESWSPYHYAYNNPVGYVDLYGLAPSQGADDLSNEQWIKSSNPGNRGSEALGGSPYLEKYYRTLNKIEGRASNLRNYKYPKGEWDFYAPGREGTDEHFRIYGFDNRTHIYYDSWFHAKISFAEQHAYNMYIDGKGIEPVNIEFDLISLGIGVRSFGLGLMESATAEGGYINLASSGRTAHILAGDATGGGHAWFGSLKSFANGLTGSKSMFPATWSNSKIMHAVSDVVVNNQWIQQTGKAGAMFTKSGQPVRFVVEGTYQGTRMRVITTHTDIITAFPIK
ncbi:RHS repeat-associated core domain-containing protein, partial [Pseudarcicella hirudinis]